MCGQIILLNGPSSSGKSTLAKALQSLIRERRNETYAVVSIDDFLQMTADDVIYEDDVYEISGRLCERTLELLQTNPGVIIDHVITSERIFTQLKTMCGTCPLFTVRVSCSLDVLKEREKERGNRCPGSAEASLEYLFPKEGYDLTVETHLMSAGECAEKICEKLFPCDEPGREGMKKMIRGTNVILREQRPEDAAFYAYWFSQPRIMFQCGFTEPTDEEKERTRILTDHRSEDSDWYTVTDLNGNILGETGLLRMWPAWHCTDLTIIIPDPAVQHKGYGTEAICLMLDLAFDKYDMNRVAIGVVGLNTDALAFYKKVGFKQEGIEEQGYFYNNEYSDFIMMRILREEWRQNPMCGMQSSKCN